MKFWGQEIDSTDSGYGRVEIVGLFVNHMSVDGGGAGGKRVSC